MLLAFNDIHTLSIGAEFTEPFVVRCDGGGIAFDLEVMRTESDL